MTSPCLAACIVGSITCRAQSGFRCRRPPRLISFCSDTNETVVSPIWPYPQACSGLEIASNASIQSCPTSAHLACGSFSLSGGYLQVVPGQTVFLQSGREALLVETTDNSNALLVVNTSGKANVVEETGKGKLSKLPLSVLKDLDAVAALAAGEGPPGAIHGAELIRQVGGRLTDHLEKRTPRFES